MSENVGERIKALRIEQGMTLSDLSEKANISISYLSQIERDKTTPSLTTLTSIARALDVGLRYFFESDAEVVHVVRANAGSGGIEPGDWVAQARMTFEEANGKIEVYRVVLRPGSPSQHLTPHAGEEFGFVLAGELTITLGGEVFVLAAGDSIHYDAVQPHAWSNPGTESCVIIWARSPSKLERLP